VEIVAPLPIAPSAASPQVYTSPFSPTANPKSFPVVICLIALPAKNSIGRGTFSSTGSPCPKAPNPLKKVVRPPNPQENIYPSLVLIIV